MFDLFYLPLHRVGSEEKPDLPGFLALSAPRNANRNRHGEMLIILLTITRNAAFSEMDLRALLEKMASGYFKTSGTVTACLRQSVQNLNDYLYRINRKNADKVPPLSGCLNLAILRRDVLILLQSGSTHSLLLGHSQKTDFYEAMTGSEIGLSQIVRTSYHQTTVLPADILVFLPDPPDGFASRIPPGDTRISLEQLRRSLSGLGSDPLQAALMQFKAGSGEVHPMKARIPLEEASGSRTPVPGVVERYSIPEAIVKDEPSQVEENRTSTVVERLSPDRVARRQTTPGRSGNPLRMAATPRVKLSWIEKIKTVVLGRKHMHRQRQEKVMRSVVPSHQPINLSSMEQTSQIQGADNRLAPPNSQVPEQIVQPGDVPQSPVVQPTRGFFQQQTIQKSNRQPSPVSEFASMLAAGVKSVDLRKRMGTLWRGGQKAQQRFGEGGGKLLTNILPNQPAQPIALSPALMLFIALAVPLVVISFAATIYFQEGPGRQHQVLLEQSREQVIQANNQEDLVTQRSNLVQALASLDKAEKYLISDTSHAMRVEIQTALDKADGIVRVNFETVADGLDSDVMVKQIQANTTDVYLLDGNMGSVLRLMRFEQNYSQDRNFICGPGQLGGGSIGQLVDMVQVPNNSKKASVLAIDSFGTLLYCIPGSPPLSNSLIPPDTGWGRISGLFFDRGLLYVLDIEKNSVYIYTGDVDLVFPSPPREYFDDQIPEMGDVIDFEVDAEDLFFLHMDGRMNRCTFRIHELYKTRCTDDVAYTDPRYGKSEQLVSFPAAQFAQMILTSPPDPSLFILDSNAPGIYHFGPTLMLHRQLQMQLYPNFDKPTKKATAFTIAPGRIIWWAFGNQVYYGSLP